MSEEKREKIKIFDLQPYEIAMVQFGPSISIKSSNGNSLICLGAIEEILAGEGLITIVYRSGRIRSLSTEESAEFHRKMLAGAEQITSQMRAQQSAQANHLAQQLGIIRPH